MDIKKKKISKSEFVIMDILWNSTTSLNRHQIADYIQNVLKINNWQIATISTFISRLYEKGVIAYEKRDKIYCYYPKITKIEYFQTIINNDLHDVFDQSLEEIILTYTGNEINNSNIDKIKIILNNLTKDTL